MVTKRLEEVTNIPVQAVLFCEALFWSRNMTKIIQSKNFQEFGPILTYFTRSLGDLSTGQMANTEHTELYRKLILWMISSRDTTQELMELKSLNEISYEWLRILRYSYAKKNTTFTLNDTMTDEARTERSLKSSMKSATKTSDSSANRISMKQIYEDFQVNQMRFSMAYDFEYVDMSAQIAVTPLTEKCFLNLTSALGALKAGCLIGPNNVGKQQTIHQLANQCGQHLQEINCDEFLTSRIATWYVKGLASSGSWVLFNKIEKLAPSKKNHFVRSVPWKIFKIYKYI